MHVDGNGTTNVYSTVTWNMTQLSYTYNNVDDYTMSNVYVDLFSESNKAYHFFQIMYLVWARYSMSYWSALNGRKIVNLPFQSERDNG